MSATMPKSPRTFTLSDGTAVLSSRDLATELVRLKLTGAQLRELEELFRATLISIEAQLEARPHVDGDETREEWRKRASGACVANSVQLALVRRHIRDLEAQAPTEPAPAHVLDADAGFALAFLDAAKDLLDLETFGRVSATAAQRVAA